MKKKEDNRDMVEAAVAARAAAYDSAMDASRNSMNEGVKATRNLTAAQSKRELEAAAAAAPEPSFLNKEAPKGAKVWYGKDWDKINKLFKHKT